MKGKYEKVPAQADSLMDQALLDVGVKFFQWLKTDGAAEALDGQWETVKANRRENDVKRIFRGAACVGLCALVGLVLLWWLNAELLDPAAAWPAFTVVALLAGVGLGSCLVRG